MYTVTNQTDSNRVVWEYDEEYETRGSWELERLEDGRLLALVAVHQTRCSHCGQWSDVDSIGDIVISGDPAELESYARECFDLES